MRYRSLKNNYKSTWLLENDYKFWIIYNNFPAILKGYTDVSWITTASDDKSTSI